MAGNEPLEHGQSTPVTVIIDDDGAEPVEMSIVPDQSINRAVFTEYDPVELDDDIDARYITKSSIWSWALWDLSTQPFSTIIITFIFIPLYLTNTGFLDARYLALPVNDPIRIRAMDNLAASIGGWITIAGILIALLAPALGQRADGSGRRKAWLAVSNLLLVLIMALLFFVRPHPQYFMVGAMLVAIGAVVNMVANVNYNALLSSVSTSASADRVSGLGFSFGYFGGIAALLFMVIFERSNWFGLAADDGLPFRVVALACAIWALLFGWPLYRYVKELPLSSGRQKVKFVQYYATTFEMIRDLFTASRATFWFIVASAIYRDGLTGIFTFGAIVAAISFGFTAQMVILFGLIASLVVGISTLLFGHLDSKWGARRVIIISLAVLLAAGIIALIFHEMGTIVFWIFGLILCATVGPAQAASRAYLAKLTPPGHESEVLGLYATIGKAALFLSAAMWTIFIATFGATIWGLLGVLLVIALGLAVLMFLVPDGSTAADSAFLMQYGAADDD